MISSNKKQLNLSPSKSRSVFQQIKATEAECVIIPALAAVLKATCSFYYFYSYSVLLLAFIVFIIRFCAFATVYSVKHLGYELCYTNKGAFASSILSSSRGHGDCLYPVFSETDRRGTQDGQTSVPACPERTSLADKVHIKISVVYSEAIYSIITWRKVRVKELKQATS